MKIEDIEKGVRISFNGCKGTIKRVNYDWWGGVIDVDLEFDDKDLIPLTLKWKEEFDRMIKLDNLDQITKKDNNGCTCGAKYTSFPKYHLRFCSQYTDKTIV